MGAPGGLCAFANLTVMQARTADLQNESTWPSCTFTLAAVGFRGSSLLMEWASSRAGRKIRLRGAGTRRL